MIGMERRRLLGRGASWERGRVGGEQVMRREGNYGYAMGLITGRRGLQVKQAKYQKEKRSEHMIYMTRLHQVYIANEGIFASKKTQHQTPETRRPTHSSPPYPQPSTSQTQRAPPEA